MSMVRVEYKLLGQEEQKVRGWDVRLQGGVFVMDKSVRDGDEIKIEQVILGSPMDLELFDVHPCDGSIKEHLAKCAQWRLTDEELEELMR